MTHVRRMRWKVCCTQREQEVVLLQPNSTHCAAVMLAGAVSASAATTVPHGVHARPLLPYVSLIHMWTPSTPHQTSVSPHALLAPWGVAQLFF
jgi:hypothetical protein